MTTQGEGAACFATLAQELSAFIDGYAEVFKGRTHSSVTKAKQYVRGIFQAEKSNMEKMSEWAAGSDHQNVNHFISQSPWEVTTLIDRIGYDTEQELHKVPQQTGQPIGYVVDESGWRKQGMQSVGVAR